MTNARARLEAQRQSVGERHPDYATGLNQLALLLIMHGDPERAEPLLRQALEVRREALGERHPDYATNLSSLAGLLWARGDLDGAEPLLRQALEVRWEVLGPSHPKSVVSLHSLDQLLKAKRDWNELERPPAAVSPAPAPPSHPVVEAAPPPRPAPTYQPPTPAPPPPEPSTPVAPPVAVVVPQPEPQPVPIPAPAPASPVATAGPSVEQQCAALEQRVHALSDDFARTGRQLLSSVDALRTQGKPPQEALLGELTGCGRRFSELRDESLKLGSSIGRGAAPSELESLESLTNYLHNVAEQAARHAKFAALRDKALSTLDRVGALTHADRPDFAPLDSIKAQARDLRRSYAEAPLAEPAAELLRLAEGNHPFGAVLQLAEGEGAMNDEQWATALETVEREFGKPLSVAAARSKIVLSK